MKSISLAVVFMMTFGSFLVVRSQNYAGYHTFVWNQADSTGIKINNVSLFPMPLIPSTDDVIREHGVIFDATFKRNTVGPVLANLGVKACIPRGLLCVPVPWYV
jgi:hypothetical protein